INRAIMNGETETGVTTFLLNHEIDKGAIIGQIREPIHPEDNIGTLYDRLMNIGKGLVTETVDRIAAGDCTPVVQEHIDESTLRPAPKIFKDDCLVDWTWDGRRIIDFIRGLSPYPAAWTRMLRDGEDAGSAKIFAAHFEPLTDGDTETPGAIVSDNRTYMSVRCNDGYICIDSIQIAGKKRLSVRELLAGFRDAGQYRFSH
ncbi:MAG: methionyl-tRNA formyltransferase, partial [Alistipes sp.]|nr:methionyl-tRNA formyltransferase [Alistipes sp.]